MSSNVREILAKADTSVSDLLDGGKLNAEQSDKFYESVIEQAVLLGDVRTVQMPSDKYNIDKIAFGSRMWRAAPSSGTPLASEDRYRPTYDQVQLDVNEIIAEFRIPYDVLEDNIEKDQLQDTFMSMASRRTSADFEELLIQGNTSSDDPFLALSDGALALAGNPYDGSSLSAIDKEVFKAAMDNMPAKYFRNLNDMKFYMSPHNTVEYRYSLAGRGTDLGDESYVNRPGLSAFGVPVASADFMPGANILFTFPQNLILGIHRDIMIETERDIRNRELVVVMTSRIDVKMEEPEAAVNVSNLSW